MSQVQHSELLVLGGSSDIGCHAIRFALQSKNFSRVIAHFATQKAELEKLQSEFGKERLIVESCDFSSQEKTREFFLRLAETFPACTHLLHLPALRFEYLRLKALDWNRIEQELIVQVHSAFIALKTYSFQRAVFLLSDVVEGTPPSALTHYVLAKYALMGLVRSVAGDYKRKKKGIFTVSPGMVNTKFVQGIPERMREIAASNNKDGKLIEPIQVAEFLLEVLNQTSSEDSGSNFTLG